MHPLERMKASKTDQYDDGVLLDNPRMPYLGEALHLYTAARQKQDRKGVEALIFPFAYLLAASNFKEAGARAGVQDCRLYRLRHGGASHDVASKVRSLLEVKKRGRWISDNSLRRYQKSVVLLTEEARLTCAQKSRAARIEKNLELHLKRRIHSFSRGAAKG